MPIADSRHPQQTSSSSLSSLQSLHPRIHVRLSIRPNETLHGHSRLINDSVQVTKPLWDKLWGHSTQGPTSASLPVSIVVSDEALATFQVSESNQPTKSLLNAVVTRAMLLSSSIDGHIAEDAEQECFVTSEFATKYLPNVNFDPPVSIGLQCTDLVVLDEVILAALSDEAYTTIAADPSLMTSYFLPAGREPVIIRYGQTYIIQGANGEEYPVKVLMCNSVLQGILEEETSIIFTDMTEKLPEPNTGTELFLAGAVPHTQFLSAVTSDDPDDLLEFNGDFIASQILAREHMRRPGKNNAFKDLHFSIAELEDDDDDEDNEDGDDLEDDAEDEDGRLSLDLDDSGDEIDGRKIRRDLNGGGLLSSRRTRPFTEDEMVNGHHRGHNSKELAPRTSVEFVPWVLKAPIPAFKLSPRPAPEDDPEARVFVDVSLLAKLKVFSGDWVLISTASPSSSVENSTLSQPKSRFCKIFGLTLPIASSSTSSDDNNGSTSGLPRVYMPPSLHFNLGCSTSKTVWLDAAQLKEDDLGVARAVTVARVASPPTVDKALQVACLEALKRWFEEYERVVCEGDVIGVDIDEEVAKMAAVTSNATVAAAAGGSELDNDNVSLWPLPASPLKTRIYFKLTHLEDSAIPGKHTQRVDPSMTKMIQSGLEHSRVPPRLRRHDRSPAILSLDDPGAPSVFPKLHQLVSAGLHPYSSRLGLNCTVLLHGARGIGKRTVVEWVANMTGIHVMDVNCFDIASETEAKTEVAVRAKFDKAMACGPCILLFRHIDALARKNVALETGQEPILSTVLKDCFTQLGESFKKTGHPVTVIATTSDIDKVPTSVLGCFLHEMVYEAPNEVQRLAILRNLTSRTPLGPDVSLNSLATQTAALVAKDLVNLVSRAGLIALDRVEKSIQEWNKGHIRPSSIVSAGVAVTAADFDSALNKARASYSDSIGAPKIPNVSWDDVGGLASVKNDILDTIQLPLEHPELFASGLKKRSGILLYGPPGTGKTLLAKAVATSCSLNFFSVKGPELLNMYIGESEANVRRVFQRARDAKPCVIFFDELDSVAPKRGEKGDSGGVMDRIVSQLLAELDGMNGSEGSGDVFVIGATNRPDLLDPALLRPGRFDKLLYLSVSTKHEEQLRILQALTRKFRLHPDLDLRDIAERCPFNYTGADFYALCSDAMLKAMARTAHAIEDRIHAINTDPSILPSVARPITSQYYLDHLVTPEEILVQVTETDFDQALRELVPSVSAQELEHYRQVQQMFNSDDFKRELEKAAEEEEKEKKAKEDEEKQRRLRREQEVISELRGSVEETPQTVLGDGTATEAERQEVGEQVEITQANQALAAVVIDDDGHEVEVPVFTAAAKGKGKAKAIAEHEVNDAVCQQQQILEEQQVQVNPPPSLGHTGGSSSRKGKGKGKGRK
ncbi:peroxisomal assembly protein [Actinomortierella wolfii]|nr:peroxisomal assembly protein [Actinomortierella wolfii]